MELELVRTEDGLTVHLAHRRSGLTAVIRGTRSTRDIKRAEASLKGCLASAYLPPIVGLELHLSDESERALIEAQNRRGKSSAA